MNKKKQTNKMEEKPKSSSFMVGEPAAEYHTTISKSNLNSGIEEENYSLEEFKSRFEEKLEKRLGFKISL